MTLENTAVVIANFPHFGGRKGQAYMLYHELGYIGMKLYDRIRKNIKRLLGQEVSKREMLPPREYYEHIRPMKSGEIWAEDFTDVTVECRTFKVAVVLDVYDEYYLGWAVDSRATAALVGLPVDQALEKTGKGPEKFLLSDNGSQERAGVFLTIRVGYRLSITHGAVGKAIVAFLPESEREEILRQERLLFHGDASKLDRLRLQASSSCAGKPAMPLTLARCSMV